LGAVLDHGLAAVESACAEALNCFNAASRSSAISATMMPGGQGGGETF
jgi:hypothetical protein